MELDKKQVANSSVLSRLLEELSWEGNQVRQYRSGGRGLENVLTAEALQALDFLPRTSFLGSVISEAHGADIARAQLITEIEEAQFTFLPGVQYLILSGNCHQTKLPVQPDGLIETQSIYAVVEAKRIRRSSFQPEQLAREFVLALRNSGRCTPLLLLILGSEPPVSVQGNGRQTISDAISLYLESVLDRAEDHSLTVEEAFSKIQDVVCWITWQEIAAIVESQTQTFQADESSVKASIVRLAKSVTNAIAWHA